MKPIELYIGLDVHKDSTTIAVAEPVIMQAMSYRNAHPPGPATPNMR
jgi:hypothetical protein